MVVFQEREREGEKKKRGERREETLKSFVGVLSGGDTPVPIPNTEVKSSSGDGTAGEPLWESSSMPTLWTWRGKPFQVLFFDRVGAA